MKRLEQVALAVVIIVLLAVLVSAVVYGYVVVPKISDSGFTHVDAHLAQDDADRIEIIVSDVSYVEDGQIYNLFTTCRWTDFSTLVRIHLAGVKSDARVRIGQHYDSFESLLVRESGDWAIYVEEDRMEAFSAALVRKGG